MSERPLRIVSYNVRYFGHALRGLATTRASIERIAVRLASLTPLPDVICLQEVETRSLRSTLAFPGAATQLEAFMAVMEKAFAASELAFPYDAFHFRAHTYQFRSTTLYTTGLAVIVNRDRLRVEGHNVLSPHAITHHHVARLKDSKQSRICAHVRLTTAGGRKLHVFNTHLSLPTPFTREFWSEKEKMGFGLNQLIEAKKLASFVQAHADADPFVVGGDFNSAPASPVYRYLSEEVGWVGAQQALRQIDGSSSRAFPTAGFFRFRMHLDHLFGGNGIRWVDLTGTEPFGRGPFHGLSDHIPLIARFEPPTEGKASSEAV
jgi:endonuclease/exonuclease/phosphatase family metal-dependent hydrolase